MADKKPTYTLPYLASIRSASGEVYSCFDEEVGILIVSVDLARAREVEVDTEKKTLTFEVRHLLKTGNVEYVPKTKIVRFSDPNKKKSA